MLGRLLSMESNYKSSLLKTPTFLELEDKIVVTIEMIFAKIR